MPLTIVTDLGPRLACNTWISSFSGSARRNCFVESTVPFPVRCLSCLLSGALLPRDDSGDARGLDLDGTPNLDDVGRCSCGFPANNPSEEMEATTFVLIVKPLAFFLGCWDECESSSGLIWHGGTLLVVVLGTTINPELTTIDDNNTVIELIFISLLDLEIGGRGNS